MANFCKEQAIYQIISSHYILAVVAVELSIHKLKINFVTFIKVRDSLTFN